MRTSLSTLVVLLAVSPSACTSKPAAQETTATASVVQQTDPTAVRASIESANARFLAALQKGDTATALLSYTDDAVVMMPNDKAWTGRDAIAKGLAAFASQVTIKDGKATTSDVTLSGDIALETGTYEWNMVPKGGKPIHDVGKYLTAWKRQADGSWRIIRDINNSDMPAK